MIKPINKDLIEISLDVVILSVVHLLGENSSDLCHGIGQ